MAIEVIDGIIYHNNQAVAKLAANLTHIDEKLFINEIELGGEDYTKYCDFYQIHAEGLGQADMLDSVKEGLTKELVAMIDPKWGTITQKAIEEAIDAYGWSDYTVKYVTSIE